MENTISERLRMALMHITNAKVDMRELHVQLQEVLEFIDARNTRKDGYFHPSDLQHVQQRLREMQTFIGAKP